MFTLQAAFPRMFDTLSFQEKWVTCWIIGLIFTIPISTAGASIALIVIILTWLIEKNWQAKLLLFTTSPLTFVLMLLVGWQLIRFIGTPASIEHGIGALKDISRLIVFPILFYYFQKPKLAIFALKVFLFAMVLTLFLAFLKYYGGWEFKEGYSKAAVFKSHIKTSYLMSMAAFFIAHLAVSMKRFQIPSYFLLATCGYYILFMNEGRIGYILFSLLFILFAFQRFRLKGLMVSIMCLTLVLSLAYQFSTPFYKRLTMLDKDILIYQTKGDLGVSSLGARMSFVEESLERIQVHPLLGWGTGAFSEAYQVNQESNFLMTDNPHNTFLKTWVEQGLIGLILLLYFLWKAFRLSFTLPAPYNYLTQGVVLSFVVGCLGNCWLTDFTESLFFISMLSILYSFYPKPSHSKLAKFH